MAASSALLKAITTAKKTATTTTSTKTPTAVKPTTTTAKTPAQSVATQKKAVATVAPKATTPSSGITAAMDREIQRKAAAGIKLDAPTAAKQALYNQYATKVTTSPVGTPTVVKTPAATAPKVGLTGVQRALAIYKNAVDKGVITPTPKNATVTPTAPTPAAPAGVTLEEVQSLLAQSQKANFDEQFAAYKNSYDSQVADLMKQLDSQSSKYDQLLQQINYKNSQDVNQVNAPRVDGSALFEPQGSTSPQAIIGGTSGNNSMNSALFRYMNSVWNGGF